MKNKKLILIIAIVFIFIINIFQINSFASTDQAGVFGAAELHNAYGYQRCILARDGLSALGYQVTGYNDYVTSRSTITDYITDSGNNYGLYLIGHGATGIFSIRQEGTSSDLLTPTNGTIRGYWHFVFVDSCSSANGDSLARAFKTIGYSNRAYLGWYTTVYTGWAHAWAQQFWAHVGENTLRQIALDATEVSDVPGTTPIRMYGDTNWWGWAW